MMAYTTLNKILSHSPRKSGWAKLLRHLNKTKADDEPLALTTILDSNGIEDALWCLRACDGIDREARLYTVWCARQVQHLMTDQRSLDALDVAERHANGEATDAELAAASAAAKAAARAAARDATRAAAWDAAWAAESAAASAAVKAAAWAAASAAARDAASAAASAAARGTARGTAWVAANAAAWDAQEAEFRRVFCSTEEVIK